MPRGGRREGSGRKPLGAGRRKYTLYAALTPATVAEVDALAEAVGEKRAVIIARAIEAYLADTAGVRPDGDAPAPVRK